MPSILSNGSRRVLKYFNKHGFKDIFLTIYILEESADFKDVVALEQYLIDTLRPSLNVDLIATGTGYHTPMGLEIKKRLRKERGTAIYIYNIKMELIYIFDSKQDMYNSIGISYRTLNDCLITGKLYLNYFFLSLDIVEESAKESLLNLDNIKLLVDEKRLSNPTNHPFSTRILAEYKGDSSKNRIFTSLHNLSNELKGDRGTMRDYLKGIKSGYYRGI